MHKETIRVASQLEDCSAIVSRNKGRRGESQRYLFVLGLLLAALGAGARQLEHFRYVVGRRTA